MARLLVSVRSVQEAWRAYRGGADIVDLKDPKRGALGPTSSRVWSRVLEALNEHLPCSAALGEWHQFSGEKQPLLSRFHYVKVGLAGARDSRSWTGCWQRLIDQLGRADSLVAVIYADWCRARAPAPQEVFDAATAWGCRTILWDTYEKDRPLTAWISWVELASWVQQARRCGMITAVAGSLTAAMIPAACATGAEVIAVRTAACRGGRMGAVCRERVANLASLVRGCSPGAGHPTPGAAASATFLAHASR